jgi:hypothetical protein
MDLVVVVLVSGRRTLLFWKMYLDLISDNFITEMHFYGT